MYQILMPIKYAKKCQTEPDEGFHKKCHLAINVHKLTKILLFYVVFYAGLAGFFSAMMVVFFQTLDSKIPKWQGDESLIGSNPGLGFRPMPPDANVESTLIWFKASDEKNYRHWTDELDKFLEEYKKRGTQPGAHNIEQCDYDRPPQPGKVCDVNIRDLHPCTSENAYNFKHSGPCIFLKLNKIYGWKPVFYNNTDDLPEKMSEELKRYIHDQKQRNAKSVNTVWVTCEGENPADVENIGPINYMPERGFPGYFFPYENNEGYLSPIVAVYFERPVSGVLINIECKAWAHNIHHDRLERRGSVHFELMID
ncbi:Sodium/potassium-transporting ATPase subunit beta-2 [Polyplax serrata]|uniref:Sodium/potassium-transporting ATPase subunit beta-2 n=1 Tax=Polyplax serrata TaxID=468196 RepID=A0AAN8NTR2_POLSC